jgi:type I restriction enzyme S subunit
MKLVDTTLANILDFYNGKVTKSSEQGNVPIYGSNGIIGLTNRKLYKDAIILGRVGAYCGSVMRCKDEFWASDNTIVVKPKQDIANINYCYYLLKNLNLNNYAGGAAQPLITQTTLKQIKIKIPNIDEQKRIANILSAYDDLIENNQKQIKLLEEAAMRLYKEWFVKLRFPGHENTKIVDGVPERWEV